MSRFQIFIQILNLTINAKKVLQHMIVTAKKCKCCWPRNKNTIATYIFKVDFPNLLYIKKSQKSLPKCTFKYGTTVWNAMQLNKVLTINFWGSFYYVKVLFLYLLTLTNCIAAII